MRSSITIRPPLLLALLLTTTTACGLQAQAIGALQGTSHRSPAVDTAVRDIAGIVTAVEPDGFWMQDAGDGDPLSSDAIYVFRGRRLGKPRVGDAVTVSGQVQEFRPGGAAGANNLSTTRIDASGAAGASAGWSRVSSGNRLPEATVIGPGFLPPTAIAPTVGNVETHPGYRLQPAAYAIDFFEALEGMRVAIASAQSVGPRNRYGEIPVIAVAQAGMTGIVTAGSGGVVVGPGRFNGHRITLDDRLRASPAVHSGARLDGIVGVLDYSWPATTSRTSAATRRVRASSPLPGRSCTPWAHRNCSRCRKCRTTTAWRTAARSPPTSRWGD